MSEPASIDAIQALLGTLKLDCVICHESISRADFESGHVIAMTGPKHPVAAHTQHFFTGTPPTQTWDYTQNMRKMAFSYAIRNDLPMKGFE